MSKPEFVSLHNHSHHSMLDGFSKVEEYLETTKKLGQKGLGMTEHGNVFSVYELINYSKKYDITPIPGIEAYVAPLNPEGAKAKYPIFYGANGQKAAEFDVSNNGAYLHQTIWAINPTGLKNLFKLSTMSNNPEHFYQAPRIDFNMLAEHSDGLVVATGCPSSEISTRFLLGQDDKAYEYAGRLKEIFGDRLFVEIMDHNMSIDLERRLLTKQLELSKKMGIELLATNDSHYAHKKDAIHHEEMLATQSGSRMSDATINNGGKRFAFEGEEYYLKTAEQMDKIFPNRDYPRALSNTLKIAEMAQDVHLSFDPHLRPNVELPKNMDQLTYYKHLLSEGFKKRYGNSPIEVKREAKKRVNYELEVIHSSDFIGYMLTVRDYLMWARENFSTRNEQDEILALSVGVGRGSVGGSIHAFLLEISELDPIKHDLVFERFLSAGRGATYRIVYDDGTSEEIVVSDKKTVIRDGKKESKYIHELKQGDTIIS